MTPALTKPFCVSQAIPMVMCVMMLPMPSVSWGDARAVVPLIALLQQYDEKHSVDSAAAMGLERLGQPAVSALLDVLKDGTRQARGLAASVLGGLGDPCAIEPLAALLSDTDHHLRIAAIESLAEIGVSECLSLIQRCLEDPVPKVRENAEYWVNELTAVGITGRENTHDDEQRIKTLAGAE